MAKKLKELRNFIIGTNSSPSASDVPDEASTYSLNIESLDEEGKLKGTKRSTALKVGDSTNNYIVSLGGATITAGTSSFTYNILNTTAQTTPSSISADGTEWLKWKALRKSFVSLVQTNQYVASAELLSGYQASNGSWVQSGYGDSGFNLEHSLNQTETLLTFTTQTYQGHAFDAGTKIKITSGSNTEYMLVTAVQTPESNNNSYTFKLTVTRGVFGTTDSDGEPIAGAAYDHANDTDIHVQQQFGAMSVTWVEEAEDIQDIEFKMTIDT